MKRVSREHENRVNTETIKGQWVIFLYLTSVSSTDLRICAKSNWMFHSSI